MLKHHFSIVWNKMDKSVAHLIIEEGEDIKPLVAFGRSDYLSQEEFEKLMEVIGDSLCKM